MQFSYVKNTDLVVSDILRIGNATFIWPLEVLKKRSLCFCN